MDNLHAPTVPSGPTFNAASANGDTGQLSFAELQQRKDNLEAELKAMGSVLDSHGIDMSTSLLTNDGFPRADLDVAQIRTTRARIIRLRNDHKDLMTVIENYLHEYFANIDHSSDAQTPGGNTESSILPDTQSGTLDEPFAKVNTVATGSPAEQAGLKVGDEIRNFGYVNQSNHDNLKKVAECVQGNEGGTIFIRVSRSTGVATRQELRLTLTPRRNWGGRGTLGCHILPL